jgi:hypothetical protein
MGPQEFCTESFRPPRCLLPTPQGDTGGGASPPGRGPHPTLPLPLAVAGKLHRAKPVWSRWRRGLFLLHLGGGLARAGELAVMAGFGELRSAQRAAGLEGGGAGGRPAVLAAGGLAERAQAPQIWPRWALSLRRRFATSGSVLRPGGAAGGWWCSERLRPGVHGAVGSPIWSIVGRVVGELRQR